MSVRSEETTPQEEQSSRRRVLGPLMTFLVLAALGVFVWNAVETSSARVNATTSANSLFSAGTVDLAQPNTVVQLLFDASNLFPGVELDGCVEVEYRGSIPANVRLHAQTLGGTGLDQFIDIRATLQDADSCEGVTTGDRPAVYEGTLGQFWRRHNTYGDGVDLGQMSTSDRAVLHVTASLQDNNDAQGLTTDFSLTVEARP